MKTKNLLFITLILGGILPTVFAQDNTQVGLPEGAIARLGKGGINIMRFSPDGTRLAVGTDVGLWLYDVNTGNVKALFPAQPTRVSNQEIASVQRREEWDVQTVAQVDTLAFSPDNRLIASGGSENSVIRLWELATGNELLCIPLFTTADGVHAMTFSKDSKTLITPNQLNCIFHWDVTTGKLLTTLKGESTDNEPLEDGYYGTHYRDLIAFTHDHRTFVSGDPDNGKIRLWDAVTGYQLSIFKAKSRFVLSWKEWKPQKGVNTLAFSPDKKTVASAHHDNTVRLWSTTTSTELAVLKGHKESVEALAFSPDSRMLASGGSDNRILLWDVQKGQRQTILAEHKSSVRALAFSPVKKGVLASGSSDGTVRFWNTQTGQEQSFFATGHREGVKTVAFTADNTILASAASNGTVQIWNIEKGQELPPPAVANYDKTEASVFSKDATLFASHGADTTVRSIGKFTRTTSKPHKETHLWILPTGDKLLSLPQEANTLAFSPDNKILAATTHKQGIRLWSIDSGLEMFRLKSSSSFGIKLMFSPNGRFLAINGSASKPNVWNVTTQHEITPPDINSFVDAFAFSPDSSLIAFKHNKGIDLWSVTPTGMQVRKEIRPKKYSLGDEVLVFSPDGKTLLDVKNKSWQDTIQLWDVDTGTDLGILSGHSEEITMLVFSHDRKILASGSLDGTILLWDWEKIISKAKENKGD